MSFFNVYTVSTSTEQTPSARVSFGELKFEVSLEEFEYYIFILVVEEDILFEVVVAHVRQLASS